MRATGSGLIVVLLSAAALAPLLWAALAPRGAGSVPPKDALTCPASHPIKAAVMPRTKECVYQRPDDPYYRTMRPDMCFVTEADARREDCWQAKEVF